MLDKKVVKGEKVTWNLSPVDADHFLRVVVSGPYQKISKDGGKAEETVELTMDFSSGPYNDVHLTTSFYLVCAIDGSETLLDPGPKLVIDTIGPPMYPCFPEKKEDEQVGDDYDCEEQN
jgi:hypothetical protein